MSLLRRTFARTPITDEPVDGFMLAGAVLIALAALGLVLDLLLPLCGIAAVVGVVLLHLSGRSVADAPAAAQQPAAAADPALRPAAT